MSCKYCGAPIIEGEKFCRNCGNAIPQIEKVEAETVSEPEPVKTMDDYEEYYDNHYDNNYEENYEDYYEEPTSGGGPALSIISMVFGILSNVCCCFTGFSITLGIAAVVCGIIAVVKRKSVKGMAIAGIITGGLGFILAFISLVGLFGGALDAIPEYNFNNIDELLEEFEL